MSEHDVIHITGSNVTRTKDDRDTDIGNTHTHTHTHKTLVKFGRVVPEIWSRIYRQTDRQTDMLITIFNTAPYKAE